MKKIFTFCYIMAVGLSAFLGCYLLVFNLDNLLIEYFGIHSSMIRGILYAATFLTVAFDLTYWVFYNAMVFAIRHHWLSSSMVDTDLDEYQKLPFCVLLRIAL